ncbi:nuclear hormone receptor FTZ-F1 beta isoform X2 [Aplysia californica]|nr:nuclear hormone receptor FTZ-F1 beta isoform X2 [Aplysia californica]
MSGRSELGISPVLLQAIAQTLTSSALTGARDSGKGKDSPSVSREELLSKSKMDNSTKDPNSASGIVTQLLQNLNEPIASLMSVQKDNTTLQSAASSLHQTSSDPSHSIITQAGLSMLGLSDNEGFSTSGSSSLTSVHSNKDLQTMHHSNMVISSEEISNFLLKEEPSDDSDVPQAAPPPSSQGMNTDVSSMLTALASQHIQQSMIQKTNKQQALQETLSPASHLEQSLESMGATTVAEATSAVSLSDQNRSQPQIIIYSYINNNNGRGDINLPVPSSSGNDIVVPDSEVNAADLQRTYRVLLHPSDENAVESKQTIFPPNVTIAHSSGSSITPVTDAQNTQEGMSQPCPVCGDKVSGYHYGIFTCESCKGFFKRTVQNKKTFVCPKSSDCDINSLNRKKCPACRFKRCLIMGMKLEAIRQDRTRGGRSSYEGCGSHLKNRMTPLEKKLKRISGSGDGAGSSQDIDDGTKSHRNLVAILNHNAHKQTPSPGTPQIPELLRDIMNLEPLLSDDDIPTDSIMEGPFPEQALYSYMMQLAELRLYKLVRWARNLPQFGAISTDDQILLLQNCWSELIALSLCWRSIDTPGQISISSTHHITAEWAQHLGFEEVVLRLLSITDSFRKLYLDQFEYVALKVLLLISPDVKGLKEPRKIREFQEKLQEALYTYTNSHYQNLTHKFGELLLRLPELSRISFMSKDILLKSLPETMATCGLLVELLKGENKGDSDLGNGASGSGGGLRF